MSKNLDPSTVAEFIEPANPTHRAIRKSHFDAGFLRFTLDGKLQKAYVLPPITRWGHEVRTIEGHKIHRIYIFSSKSDAYLIYRSDHQVWQVLWDLKPEQLVFYDVSDRYFYEKFENGDYGDIDDSDDEDEMDGAVLTGDDIPILDQFLRDFGLMPE